MQSCLLGWARPPKIPGMGVSICYPTVTAPGVVKDAAPTCFLTQLQGMTLQHGGRSLCILAEVIVEAIGISPQVTSDLTSQASE